jgi:hypothetical protein
MDARGFKGRSGEFLMHESSPRGLLNLSDVLLNLIQTLYEVLRCRATNLVIQKKSDENIKSWGERSRDHSHLRSLIPFLKACV